MQQRDLTARLALLLCGAYHCQPGSLGLPPGLHCRGILEVVAMVRSARAVCGQRCAAAWRIPPTLLGRIARSTNCCIDPRVCVTMVLSTAVSVPAAIGDRPRAGFLWFPECHWPAPAPDWRWVSLGCNLLCGASEVCTLALPGGPLRLSIRDCPAAASVYPLSLATLRAALSVGRRRGLLRRWRAPIATDALRGERCCTFPVCAADLSMAQAVFTNPASADRWQTLTRSLEQSLKDTSRGHGSRVTEALCSVQPELLSLLACARSAAVQTVLDYTMTPQPSMSHSGRAVYALCSPYWSKCYVGALGFEHPRPPVDRWKEHIARAKLWGSRMSTRRFRASTPALYRAISSVGVQNVVMVVLSLPATLDSAVWSANTSASCALCLTGSAATTVPRFRRCPRCWVRRHVMIY